MPPVSSAKNRDRQRWDASPVSDAGLDRRGHHLAQRALVRLKRVAFQDARHLRRIFGRRDRQAKHRDHRGIVELLEDRDADPFAGSPRTPRGS